MFNSAHERVENWWVSESKYLLLDLHRNNCEHWWQTLSSWKSNPTVLSSGLAQRGLNNSFSTEINNRRKNEFGLHLWQNRWFCPLWCSHLSVLILILPELLLFLLTISLCKLFSQLHCFLPVSSVFLLHCGWLTWKNEWPQWNYLGSAPCDKTQTHFESKFCLGEQKVLSLFTLH